MRAVLQRVLTTRDTGSAALEFLCVGVLLLVPLLYLVLALGRVQAATFAAESGAREASRLVATTAGEQTARGAAAAAVELALADQGFDVTAGRMEIECAAAPCRTPEELVTTTVSVAVELPLVPGFVRSVWPATVQVQVRRSAVADRFAAA